ncbi:hypothetical protein DL769_005627 [Monosporascus sp. CRB-8-3]|nr:hypothetical protein DL769_005627 [Monosporascus sp. CRB-8-3]
MQHRLLLFHSLLVAGTAASTTKAAQAVRRQDGPVDPGTAPDCTFFDTAYDESYDCQYFEKSWGISHADFVDVKDDYSGIKVGNSYCIEVNYGEPRPTTTSAISTVQPTPTEKPKPSPTQGGLIDTCNKFYFAWNPAVGDDCSGLWAETYYCVAVPGSPTAPPTTTPPSPTGDLKPSPTQEGLIDTCTKFYLAVAGDTCDKIVKAHGTFTFVDFLKWNPAVGEDCSGLWAKTYYCVGVPETPTARPTTTKPPPTTTRKPGGPSPTQDRIVANCQRYYNAVSGDTWQKIVDKYGAFSLAQFRSWNPAVGADCVPGTPTSPTAKPTATCNPTAPTPTQPVAICGCKKWHKVASGDNCDAIIKKYAITKVNFNRWNPNVGTDCSSL